MGTTGGLTTNACYLASMNTPTFKCEYVNFKNPQTWLDEDTRQEFLEDDIDYTQSLAIKCGDEVMIHSDGGEPEDNSFTRDWSWVKGVIEKAYAQGRKDALAEEANDRARQAAIG